MAITEYDIVPYTSHAYAETHVAHLFTMGRVAGLAPPDFREARVLELGCGSGGNLIPMAEGLPGSRFLGIDLSQVQIEHGAGLAAELGLTNIELRTQSILDFEGDGGPFDYIICHGVLSWVPEPVQAKIMSILQGHLALNGLAVISYNTLPGWNVVRSIRDMLRYHTEHISDPAEKAAQALRLLKFVTDAQTNPNEPYAAALASELALLESQPASYVLHDHLEENNHAFYFHQFVSLAAPYGLDYITDTNPAAMFLENYPPAVAEALRGLDDVVRIEQYLDFVNNRRFRSSVLCRHGQPIDRTLNAARIREFLLRSKLTFKGREGTEDVFIICSAKGGTLSTGDAVESAILHALAVCSRAPVSMDELVDVAAARSGEPRERIEAGLPQLVMRLFFTDGLRLTPHSPRCATVVSERPEASPVTRALARRQATVSNVFHEGLRLDPFTRSLVQLLDGNTTRAELEETMMARIESGELELERDNEPVTDPHERGLLMSGLIGQALEVFADSGVLVR